MSLKNLTNFLLTNTFFSFVNETISSIRLEVDICWEGWRCMGENHAVWTISRVEMPTIVTSWYSLIISGAMPHPQLIWICSIMILGLTGSHCTWQIPWHLELFCWQHTPYNGVRPILRFHITYMYLILLILFRSTYLRDFLFTLCINKADYQYAAICFPMDASILNLVSTFVSMSSHILCSIIFSTFYSSNHPDTSNWPHGPNQTPIR